MKTRPYEATLAPTPAKPSSVRHIARHRFRHTTNRAAMSGCNFPCATVLPPLPDTSPCTFPIYNAAVRS